MKKLILISVFLLFITACAAMPVEYDLPPLPAIEPPPPAAWNLTPAIRGDVIHYQVVMPVFTAQRRELVHFSRGGLEINAIYIENGEFVYEGQLLGSLRDPDLQEDIDEIRLEQARLSLQLRQLNERHAHSLQMAEAAGQPVDDTSYVRQRAVLQEQLNAINLEFNYLTEQLSHLFAFAPMDGIAVNVHEFRDGQLSTTAGLVAMIQDMDGAYFRIARNLADFMEHGERHSMVLVGMGMAAEVEVFRPEEGGSWIFFHLLDEDILVADGTLGRIVYVFGEVFDVVAVPTRAVRMAGTQPFVFVMEDGVRRIRHVEVGVSGVADTEIVSGLEIGEMVVL